MNTKKVTKKKPLKLADVESDGRTASAEDLTNDEPSFNSIEKPVVGP
jgi:hypothetical protein